MWWVFSVVAVVVVLATYLTWLAARVDRLHARAAGASVALDAQLRRRAAAAGDLGGRYAPQWGPAADALRGAARGAAEAAPPDRESAENELTRRLRELPAEQDIEAELDALGRRVALARQVHTDLVRDALGVRRQRVVRLLRLARRHPRPAYFDIDDPALADIVSAVGAPPVAGTPDLVEAVVAEQAQAPRVVRTERAASAGRV